MEFPCGIRLPQAPFCLFLDCGHAVFACFASGWLHRKLCPRLWFFLCHAFPAVFCQPFQCKCVSVQKALRLFIVYRSLQTVCFLSYSTVNVTSGVLNSLQINPIRTQESVPCHSISHFICKLPYRQKAFPVLAIDFIPQIQSVFLLRCYIQHTIRLQNNRPFHLPFRILCHGFRCKQQALSQIRHLTSRHFCQVLRRKQPFSVLLHRCVLQKKIPACLPEQSDFAPPQMPLFPLPYSSLMPDKPPFSYRILLLLIHNYYAFFPFLYHSILFRFAGYTLLTKFLRLS